jgi:hypothetical protein
MAWEELGSGSVSSLGNVVNLENGLPEQEMAMLQCDTVVNVTSAHVDALKNSLSYAGVTDLEISSGGRSISITWRKAEVWAAIIILALVAIVIVLAWRFFHEASGTLGGGTMKIAVIAGAIFLVALALGSAKSTLGIKT